MAYYYKLQISKYSDFSILVMNKMVEVVTEAEFVGLEHNTTYYWRVKRRDNQTGAESEWSNVCEFKTVPADVVIDKTVSSASGGIIEYVVGGLDRNQLKNMIVARMTTWDTKQLENIIQKCLKKEFRYVEYMGAVLGLVIGISQVLILYFMGQS